MSKLKGIRGLIFQLAILCLSFFYAPLLAQESYAERLIQDLSTAKEDTTKVYFLNELAWELKHTSLDSARLLLTQAYDLAEKLNYLKGKGDAMNYRGVTEDIHGNSKEAINYFERALEIRKELNDLAGQASLYNNIGNLEESLGDNYGAALRNYELSRRIRLELKDDRRANNALYNMGIVYESMGDYVEGLNSILLYLSNLSENDSTEIANGNNIAGNIKSEMDRFEEALAHYQKAETIHKELGNQWEYAGAVLNVGNMYDAIAEYRMDKDSLQGVENYYQKAIEKYEESLVLVADLEDEAGRSETLNNLGTTYKNLGSYYTKINKKAEAKKIWKQALSYAEEALYLRENNDEKKGLIDVYNTIGDIKRRQNKLYEAREYTELCLKLSQEIKDVKSEHNAYKDLARINFSLGNYQKAYVFREKYDQLKYSRLDEKRIQSEERRMVKYTKNLQVEETKKAEAELFLKQQELELKEARLARESTFRNSAIGGALALALLAFLLYNRNRIKNRANENLLQKNEIIEAEKQRAESLLLNILPAATAAELKENGKARARSYKSVSVLFTDFKSFTQIAEQLSPENLVAELDTCFQAFDDILTRHNIEKIKTIGDAYMCAGGLPLENDTHPTDVVKAALEMRDFMKKHRIAQRTAGKPEFRMRIGIHTGSVVAGVVGNKKFAYDIWGDAVNLAARMENSGEVGKVNISQQTYELVKNEFACTHRGKISAKNKGEVDMYFVEEKRLSL